MAAEALVRKAVAIVTWGTALACAGGPEPADPPRADLTAPCAAEVCERWAAAGPFTDWPTGADRVYLGVHTCDGWAEPAWRALRLSPGAPEWAPADAPPVTGYSFTFPSDFDASGLPALHDALQAGQPPPDPAVAAAVANAVTKGYDVHVFGPAQGRPTTGASTYFEALETPYLRAGEGGSVLMARDDCGFEAWPLP